MMELHREYLEAPRKRKCLHFAHLVDGVLVSVVLRIHLYNEKSILSSIHVGPEAVKNPFGRVVVARRRDRPAPLEHEPLQESRGWRIAAHDRGLAFAGRN